jgi:hypothetical protein
MKAAGLCLVCRRSLPLEVHHPLGRNIDPSVESLRCQRCHRQRTDFQRFDGFDLSRRQRSLRERAVTAMWLMRFELGALADAVEDHRLILRDGPASDHEQALVALGLVSSEILALAEAAGDHLRALEARPA